MRVGVKTGPSSSGPIGAGGRVEYAALGDAVNTAARLQSAAEPGEVLVGEDTLRLVEPLFDWGAADELELKGKAAPVAARVAQARDGRPRGGAGPGGRPGAGWSVASASSHAGRERSRARSPVPAASCSSPASPASARRRLLAELRDRVRGRARRRTVAHCWLEGRCVSYGESMPYWPFRDLLRTGSASSPDEPELRVRVALRRDVERLFGDRAPARSIRTSARCSGSTLEPEAAARLAELSPEALQYRTFEVVRQLCSRGWPQDGPVVVALEDLHWADADLAPAARTAAGRHRGRRAAAGPHRARPSATTRRGG